MPKMKLNKSTVPVIENHMGRNVPPGLRIAENGTIRLNSKAADLLLAGWRGNKDEFPGIFGELSEDRILSFYVNPEKGDKPEDRFKVNIAKDGAFAFGAAALLQYIKYDYVASGAQIFPVVKTKVAGQISTTKPVPEGSLEKREVKPRKARAKNHSNGATSATTAPELEPELVEA